MSRAFKHTVLITLLLSISCMSFGQGSVSRTNDLEKGDIYVISIGINDYPSFGLQLCVNDSNDLVAKIKNDKLGNPEDSSVNVYAHALNDSDATLKNIRSAFKEVIANSKVNDYFVLNFSGFSQETKSGDTVLIPYDPDFNWREIDESIVFPVVELAKLMEQIQAKHQLVISEAGSGREFAQNLIGQLFESNPIIASGTERERVLITTKGLGIERKKCPDGTELTNGSLVHFIKQHGNVLDVFKNIDAYEFQLMQSELACSYRDQKYVAIYNEKEYRDILVSRFNRINSRGSKGSSTQADNKETAERPGKTYALVIATNEYESQSDWRDLKNPINDANSVADLLSSHYGVEVEKVFDQDREEVLMKLVALKSKLQADDKLIVFVAGHGYYSDSYSDGYLVLKDSKGLDDDITMDSYLQMATLNRLLDNMPSKQIFALFDVCFGATFDLNAKDVALSNYRDLSMDITLDEFISRKSKDQSRLFMASGRYEVPDYWNNSLDHSPFADKLIKILEKEKQFISPGKIFSAMEGNATEPILKQFGSHETRGDFLLKAN
ncbi:MAG: caspase family protein [Bacteroidia bacterium]|nr:caspase family protein [Bacteroidia bacterium]MBT8269696.1 caspase family protein [Bacteroidia bacterium]NNF81279.1 caspase family protein [Flavobacteriaceae bacterium]NNK71253.1 caspase family protein [Flavobacteriaceae bacterium]